MSVLFVRSREHVCKHTREITEMVNYGTRKSSKNIIFLPALCLVTSHPLENKILKILNTIIFYTEALGQTICNGTKV